jgi:N-acetylglucosamine-6-phosphate deacetylase
MGFKGFVDIQFNGFMGIDFSDSALTLDDIRKVTRELSARGTMGYCPTICTGSMEMYRQNLGLMSAAMKDSEVGAHILGVHLEGPFISSKPGAVGAHDVRYVAEPSIETFDKFMEWSDGSISILTVAPEIPGIDELIAHAAGLGVRVMMGHHISDIPSMEKALAAGACGCTHLGNGLPSEINRHQNPLWWQLAADELWGSFITDGHHLPPEFIKVALKCKTLDRFIVISDAGALAGMPPGVYDGFGKKVEITANGRMNVYGTPYLAGSHAITIECMNYLASLNILTEEELWQVGYLNPLRFLGKSEDCFNGVECANVKFDGRQFTC